MKKANYKQLHLIEWLKNRPLIWITALEQKTDSDKGSIALFLKERNLLNEDQFQKIVDFLKEYGYRPMDQE